jgi:3-oxoacyl-[acyl-carrier protein] reductase
MDLQLRDTVAIVTGSSRGLGLASAVALAAEGSRVVVCGRDQARLEAARAQVAAAAGPSGADRVVAVRIDLSTADGPAALIEQAAARFGGVDVLVNNVGMAKGAGLVDTPDAVWQEALDYTLYPAVRASRAAVPHMIARGGGSIVLIASISGREAGGRLTYNVVKAAEISLGKALARELAPKNIRVNTIAPGSILFPGGSWHQRQQADPAGMADFVARELPFGRFGRAEEVGDAVAWLASPRASWVSGACIPVDGCQGRSNIRTADVRTPDFQRPTSKALPTPNSQLPRTLPDRVGSGDWELGVPWSLAFGNWSLI